MLRPIGEHMGISLKGLVAFYEDLLKRGRIKNIDNGTGAYNRYKHWKEHYAQVGNKYFKQRSMYE